MKKDLGTIPPFFLKERKNEQSQKAGNAFAAKYVTTSQGILSRSKILKLYHQVFENVKRISIQMMSAIRDLH